MKVMSFDYTFNPSAKQITINDYPTLKLEQLLLITNVTDNLMIYSFADQTLGGTLENGVLTLNANTTAMSATDSLQIFIEVSDEEYRDTLMYLLAQVNKKVESLGVVDSNSRLRVNIDSFVATIATMGRAINYVNYPVSGTEQPGIATGIYYQPVWVGPVDQRWEIINNARNAYANALRSRLIDG